MAELRIRRAEVTNDSPLEIEFPGADSSVSALAPYGVQCAVNDIVSVLTGSGQPIVLGKTSTGQTVAIGATTATFSASNDSTEKTVNHGLAGTPRFVSVQYVSSAIGTTAIASRITSRTSTQFKFQLNAETSLSTTVDVLWRAEL